jgi:hypothetical protein
MLAATTSGKTMEMLRPVNSYFVNENQWTFL